MKCLADIWEPVTTFPRRRGRTRTAKFEPKQIREGGKERRSLKTAIHKRCEAVLSLLTSNLLAACCQAAHIEATRCGCRAGWVLITDEPLRGLKVIESRPPPPGVYVPHQSATAAVLRCPSSPSREEGKKKILCCFETISPIDPGVRYRRMEMSKLKISDRSCVLS